MNRVQKATSILLTGDNRFLKAARVLSGVQSHTGRKSGYSPFSTLFNSGRDLNDDLTRTTLGASLAYLYASPIKPVVDVIAENGAATPRVIYGHNGDEIARSDQNPQDSELLSAIERSWKYHRYPLMNLMIRSHLLYGMTFVQNVINPYGFGQDLRWLNPNAVRINAPRGIIEDYVYSGLGRQARLSPRQVLYVRQPSPVDDVLGWSQTLNVMDEANAIVHFGKFKLAYYNNSGQPGFAILPDSDGGVTTDEVEELAALWKREFQGVDNFFKTFIGTFPASMTAFEPLDARRPLELDRDTRRRVLNGFRVPPEMIGDTEGNPYQFSAEKKRAFMQTVVNPVLTMIAEAVNAELIQSFDGKDFRFGFDLSVYDTVDEVTERQQGIESGMYRDGVISINEYRKAMDRQPIQELNNMFFVPALNTVVPLSELPALWQQQLSASVKPMAISIEKPPPALLPSGQSNDPPQVDIPAASAALGLPADETSRLYDEYIAVV